MATRTSHDPRNEPILLLRNSRIYWLSALSAGVVISIYIFFISVGTWTKWPTTTDYYAQLARAFDHGQVSLLTKPDPSILALQNPYQYDTLRKKASYPWDVSLYNGRYYVYWGAAPAVLMAVVGLVHPVKSGDQYVVFASACGLFFANLLLLFGLWKRFFSDLPVWAFEIILVLVGLVSPLLWSLNDPEIYEASILFGQFLLLGGFYFAFLSFEQPRGSPWKLTLAGICWAGAIASRITLILAIVFWIALFSLFARKSTGRGLWKSVLMMTLPLLISLAAMGWYNHARFDSPLEFGLHYQLTSSDLRKTQLFSLTYLPSNLYGYIFYGFDLQRTFPFLAADNPMHPVIFPGLTPGVLFEQTTGILWTSPFLLFALIPLLSSIRKGPPHNDLLRWVNLSLAGSTFLLFSTILLYFYQTMRFLDDVAPQLALLSGIGFWQGLQYLRGRKPGWQAAYRYAAIVLLAASCVVSFLLAISSYRYANRFDRYNPALLNAIVHFFGR
ncbi:MAG TPA: hypothetical protein VLZ89_17320 [Anaerolineales bacterium]|nr:hypothetical protein [Anaerolineales bacterium]